MAQPFFVVAFGVLMVLASLLDSRPSMDVKTGDARGADPKLVEVKDLWRCPITGEVVEKGPEVGTPVLVGTYRVHFCCGGCLESFAKLSEAEKNAKVEATAKLNLAKEG